MSALVERAFHEHYRHVYRLLLRRTRDPGDAEDLAQHVFVDAAAALAKNAPPRSMRSWLCAIAERRFVDELRRRARAERFVTLTLPLERDREPTIDQQRLGSDVADAIGRLPPDQRRVVAMKLLAGRRFSEISASLGVTEAACKMRFSRGLAVVRASLAG